MKLKDTIKISLRNIRIHLKRNLIVVAIMSVIFVLIFAMNLWLQGVNNSYTKLTNQKTDGRVVIQATSQSDSMAADDEELPEITPEEMIADIEAHGGKILSSGKLGDIVKHGDAILLPQDIVKNMILADISKAPSDAMPVLITPWDGARLLGIEFPQNFASVAEKQAEYRKYLSSILGRTFVNDSGSKYFVAGLADNNFLTNDLSFDSLGGKNKNILNPVLAAIPAPSGYTIAIDNGKTESWLIGETIGSGNMSDDYWQMIEEDLAKRISIIAVFDNPEDAYNYLLHGHAWFSQNVLEDRHTYVASTIAGLSPEYQYVMRMLRLAANIISAALGLVAAVIVIFTNIRLVDQDSKNITLYYSLGATVGQVRKVYLAYFLELMIAALVLAFSISSIAVLLFNLFNHDLISAQSMLAFGLSRPSSEIWYGVNANVIVTIIAMLALAPICVLVNNKKLKKA